MKNLNIESIKKNLIRDKIICEKSTKVEEPRLGFIKTIEYKEQNLEDTLSFDAMVVKSIILCDTTIILRIVDFVHTPLYLERASVIIDLDDFIEHGYLNYDLLQKSIIIGLDTLVPPLLNKIIPKTCESDTFYMYDDPLMLKDTALFIASADNIIYPSKLDYRHLYESDSFTISDIVKSITI